MPFPNSLASRSTWRLLGLTLSTTIFSAGLWCFVSPLTPASLLGVTANYPESQRAVTQTMAFLGARDLCIASALFWLDRLGRVKEMGVLLCCFTVVYVVDIAVVVESRGWDGGVWGLVGGGMVASFIGLGLVQER